jgi:hypothetical protein
MFLRGLCPLTPTRPFFVKRVWTPKNFEKDLISNDFLKF